MEKGKHSPLKTHKKASIPPCPQGLLSWILVGRVPEHHNTKLLGRWVHAKRIGYIQYNYICVVYMYLYRLVACVYYIFGHLYYDCLQLVVMCLGGEGCWT